MAPLGLRAAKRTRSFTSLAVASAEKQQTTYLQIKLEKDELRECEGSRRYRFELQYAPNRVETCSRFLDIEGGSEGGKIRENFN
jgi:hypothetical protein